MKVLWLTWKDLDHPLAGGAEVVNQQLARRLVADGHEVTLLVGGFPGGASVQQQDGYKIIRLGNRYTVYWQAYSYYRQYLRHWPDVVIDEVNTIPFFARRYVSQPHLLFAHMLCRQIWFYQMPPPLSWLGYIAEPLYLRLLNHQPVVAMSESTKVDLVKHGFSPTDITVLPEAIDLQPLPELPPKTWSDDPQSPNRPMLLSLGSVRAMKRTDDIVTAFEIAKATYPALRLVVAGDTSGTYGQRVLHHMQHSAYADDIEYVGRVSQSEKLELLFQATLLALTSVKEGWGLVVTEANSQGTPAVVYDVDGLRDSVRHDQTGLVCPDNPLALAESITELLHQPDHYHQLRQAAWTWSQELTFDRTYREFMGVLDRAVNSH